jgi:ribosomal protein S18 acetylase RimI-like enzyme
MTWRIRKADLKDADDLKACMEAAYAGYQQRLGGVRLPPMDADYCSEITNYPTWVVESERDIVGGLIMSFENNRALIANIAVNPECQGQGIGRALIEFAESEARDKVYSEIHLTTHAGLTENVSLYRHLGWAETGRDGSRVFMKKAI